MTKIILEAFDSCCVHAKEVMVKSKIILMAISTIFLFASIANAMGRTFFPEPVPSILFGLTIISIAELAKRLMKIQNRKPSSHPDSDNLHA